MKPLAVTGVGVVCAYGAGRDAFAAELSSVSDANAPIWSAPSSIVEQTPNARVAEFRDFEAAQFLGDKGLRNFDRLTKFMIVAAKLALENAGVKRDGQFVDGLGPDQIGILSATAYGSLEAMTELNLVAEKEDPRYINPARFPNTVINAAAGYVSIWEDLRAPNVTIVDGNCGALDAVLSAQTHLAHRRGDAFLVGGGEVVSDTLYRAVRKLGILTEGDALFAPGEPHSAGLRLGEAASYVLVERERDARARSANIDALIVGYGAAFDVPASEALLVHTSPDAIARAIKGALADANLSPNDVQLVLSSCSGLARFDEAERSALQGVFGPSIAVAAIKATYGETFGAAGALGLAAACEVLRNDIAPVLISGMLDAQVNVLVVTTVGFYGNVSAVVLRRDPQQMRTTT